LFLLSYSRRIALGLGTGDARSPWNNASIGLRNWSGLSGKDLTAGSFNEIDGKTWPVNRITTTVAAKGSKAKRSPSAGEGRV